MSSSTAPRTASCLSSLPGHTIYINNPQRLSVLSINVDATTCITTCRADDPAPQSQGGHHQQPPQSQQQQTGPTLQPPPSLNHRHASTSKLHPPPPPPSSYQSASQKLSRSRPLSHDFGQRTKDAFNEFGRLATRRQSAIERANGADTLARVADGLDAKPTSPHSRVVKRSSLQPLSLQKEQQHHQRVGPSPSTVPRELTRHHHVAFDNTIVIQADASCKYALLPHRDLRLASHSVPLTIHASTTSSDGASSAPGPIEFVAPLSTLTSNTSSSIPSSTTFDPTQLLLKVRPPAEIARESWSRSASFLTAENATNYITSEDHKIHFRFRLRLDASSTTPVSPSFPRMDRSDAAAAIAGQAPAKLLFVAASSMDRLTDAIESPQSSIATPELAALEGISRVEVTPSNQPLSPTVTRGASDCDFDWTWKSLERANGDDGARCCCAFVDLSFDGKSAILLAAMSVYVQLPPSAPRHSSMLSSTIGGASTQRGMSHADSLAIIAALNLDTDLLSPSETSPPLVSSRAGPQLCDNPSASAQPEVTPLSIDRTELALEDIVNDSPIFRAAVVNLERRTASIKKAAKAVLRAAQEARARTLKLIEAEDAVDVALDGLVNLAPETLGRLQDRVLRKARTASLQHQRDQADMIEICLERPLAKIVELCRVIQEGFKVFDNESKIYYSSTQKWLASRSHVEASPSLAASHDRTDAKQKLRELRFEQARLDLFALLQRLHGGQAEARLTQSVLQLSQWLVDLPAKLDWSSEQQKSCLAVLDASLSSALKTSDSQVHEVEACSRQLGERIRLLEHALGKSADGVADNVGAHRIDPDNDLHSANNVNGAVSAKARKFKSFLGAFAAGIQNSPLTSSKNAGFDSESTAKRAESFEPIVDEQSQVAQPRRRHSMKIRVTKGQHADSSKAMAVGPHAPSSWAYDHLPSAPRRGSELHESSRLRTGDVLDLRGRHASQDTNESISTASGGHEGSGARKPEQGLGIFAPAVENDTHGPHRSVPPEFNAALSAINATPGSDRKKEGVLWVSTKPVTGPAGADAPRGISRSTHWRECWVVLSGSGQVSEFADWKTAKALEPTNPLIDLRFATVREARGVDRRFAFEIVTRDNRRLFQAPDEETMRDWMRAISKAIESLLNGTSSVRKLDRAVRASPFGNHGSGQRAGILTEDEAEPGTEEGNDFAVRKLLDRTTKGSSQSMTDLSASAKAQNGDRKDRVKAGGHLAALSESHAETSAWSSRRGSQHQRGISNKTPISGYLGPGGLGSSAADTPASHRRDDTGVSDDASVSSRSTQGEQDAEFDRQIEANIHKSYGSQDGTGIGHSGFSHNAGAAEVDELGQLKGGVQGQGSARGTSSSTSSSKHRLVTNASVSSTATSTKMSRSAEIADISRAPENRRCADCQDSDPRWASWMLGGESCCIFICIGCSGVHRSLGVHISKVKSVDLDDWTEEQLQAARDWGNVRANAVWEHSKPAGLLPLPSDRKEFWRRKYVEQEWKDPRPKSLRAAYAAAPPDDSTEQRLTVDDVDATPTRQSVRVTDASPVVSSPIRKSQSHAKELGLRIAPVDTTPASDAVKVADGPISPRPHGPRPLPERRSVSMQASPISPLSPHSTEQSYEIDGRLKSPLSPSHRWNVRRDATALHSSADDNKSADFAAPATATQQRLLASMPTSASFPYLSTQAAADAHVSKAMLAARADPRLFPPSVLTAAATETSDLHLGDDVKLRVATSPPSLFVSNLGGRTPSPMFSDGPMRRRDQEWDTASETGSNQLEEDARRYVEYSPRSGDPPARFEAFASH
ncbi:potential Arf GTPase-activating protein [Pseudozyma hubeiensis SY62]|uniref:Potential Arf GTPase-activating protein n=1 Tax=Pseudozyma hubeiensis (strain SY62) TaxID=1305764 RepID=R9PB73_PSEHS|nr:potential Arf GTPase-activating protein [Pseudozyma hubeiensis SY62]GAC98599.1 potential Arf GTPase-activating protein [Pseudozyma hubeiensis SY62]